MLTPNHFIQVEYAPLEQKDELVASNMSAAQTLLQFDKQLNENLTQFWALWKTTYLQFLKERSATQHFQSSNKTVQRDPKVGDVVIINDDLRKRAVWRIGKITELHISSDGKIRSATLKLGSRTDVKAPPVYVRRPLKNLYFLELNELEDQNTNEETSDVEDNVSVHSIQLSVDF